MWGVHTFQTWPESRAGMGHPGEEYTVPMPLLVALMFSSTFRELEPVSLAGLGWG